MEVHHPGCLKCGFIPPTDAPAGHFCSNCGSPLFSGDSGPIDPLVGRQVAGSYVLQELVGVGGMGRVYRADQTALNRTVAVKVIHPHLLSDSQTVARFYTEARASSRLNHPNSVSIIDFGSTDDGTLYLVMEYLDGRDLANVIHDEGPLPFGRIVDVLCGALGALEEAHALGVVHRDLKPENIFLRPMNSGKRDLVKVLDFGLATITGSGNTSISQPGMVCGTPDYMSPEQGAGDPVDGRSDLYALGVVLYELLTERLPFEADTPTKVVMRHLHDPVVDPRQVAPVRKIPSTLVDVVYRALEKDAHNRYQTAREMETDLRDKWRSESELQEPQITCGTCGALSPATMKFCGSCGSRLRPSQGRISIMGGAPERRERDSDRVSFRPGSFHPPPREGRPFVGRIAQLTALTEIREEAKDGYRWMHIQGAHGTGKTRLTQEFRSLCVAEGDLVVGVSPNPARARVPYESVRELMAGLLDVSIRDLPGLHEDGAVLAEPLVAAGFSELLEPEGLRGFQVSRAPAVAMTLAAAMEAGKQRTGSGVVVVIVDDYDLCDGLTRQVVRHLAETATPGILVISNGRSDPMDGVRRETSVPYHVLKLSGFDSGELSLYMNQIGEVRSKQYPNGVTPLYAELAHALGLDLCEHKDSTHRLADLVSYRMGELEFDPRRLLQLVSVIGDRADLGLLKELATPVELSGLEVLLDNGWVYEDSDGVRMMHPLIRDVVVSSIPAEARRALFERVLEGVCGTDRVEATIELRAHYMSGTGQGAGAILLLERAGDGALERGDADGAVEAYRHAVERGRRGLLESGDESLLSAFVAVSRKLATALERSGDAVGADGILREVLDLPGPRTADRAKVLMGLGHVAILRDKPRDGVRFFGQALEITERLEDSALQAEVLVGSAQARRLLDDELGAANALQRAVRLMPAKDMGDESVMVRGLLAQWLLELGDLETAAQHLERVEQSLTGEHAPALVAMICGVRGLFQQSSGVPEDALQSYREAARGAAEAGDVHGQRRWRDHALKLQAN